MVAFLRMALATGNLTRVSASQFVTGNTNKEESAGGITRYLTE
jgi:hypothetical protein